MGQGLLRPLIFQPPTPPTYKLEYPSHPPPPLLPSSNSQQAGENRKNTRAQALLHHQMYGFIGGSNEFMFWLDTKNSKKIPCAFIQRRNARLNILFAHGNAEDLGLILPWFRDVVSPRLNANIMLFDYYGYGATQTLKLADEEEVFLSSSSNLKTTSSAAYPSEEDVYADIEAAFSYLVNVQKIPENEIILFGRSLGSGAVCHMAEKASMDGNPVRGIILQSPLLSIFRVAINFRSSFPGDKFCNIDKLYKCNCPVFVIHGVQDQVVPVWHGEDLIDSVKKELRHPPFWILSAGHNDVETTAKEEYFERIEKFISRLYPEDAIY